MKLTSKITMDLLAPGVAPLVSTVQDDHFSREIAITLLADRKSWEIPGDAYALIRFRKADGRGGTYDTMPDGTRAWQAKGNVLTIRLAPQVLTMPGFVMLTVSLMSGDSRLSTFGITVQVCPAAKGGSTESGDYENVSGFLKFAGGAQPGQVLQVAEVDGDGRILGLTAGENPLVQADGRAMLNPAVGVGAENLTFTPLMAEDLFDTEEQALFTNWFDAHPVQYNKVLNGAEVADTHLALCVTEPIPVKNGDVIRMADFSLYTGVGYSRICVFNADGTVRGSANGKALASEGGSWWVANPVYDEAGNVSEFTVDHVTEGCYLIICTEISVTGENPILTINEPIAYTQGSGTRLKPGIQMDHSQILNAPGPDGWSILPHEHLNICYSGINRKPINTVAHFTDAAENFGYNALKCDVRPTSDGELVCCHDAGFTFDSNGYITTFDRENPDNQTLIHGLTAATVLGYSFRTGEHPCLVGDYLDVCRKYGKIAFITIRNEHLDVVIPKLLEELRAHNMGRSAIINSMTYDSLVQWRRQDKTVMVNYTLDPGMAMDRTQIDRAVGLGYCSLCGFSLSDEAAAPSASCDFAYAREKGVRLLEAIAYHPDSPGICYDMGYDGCMIGFPWKPAGYSRAEIDAIMGRYIADIDALIGGEA